MVGMFATVVAALILFVFWLAGYTVLNLPESLNNKPITEIMFDVGLFGHIKRVLAGFLTVAGIVIVLYKIGSLINRFEISKDDPA